MSSGGKTQKVEWKEKAVEKGAETKRITKIFEDYLEKPVLDFRAQLTDRLESVLHHPQTRLCITLGNQDGEAGNVSSEHC